MKTQKNRFRTFAAVSLGIMGSVFLAVFDGLRAEDTAAEKAVPKAKNVILMIGDGMGFNADLAGTYWRFGENDQQVYHKFPKRLACSTFSIKDKAYDGSQAKGYDPEVFWQGMKGNELSDTDFTRTTDSAASATAINTGFKTKRGRIGMDFEAKSLKSYAQYAAEAGRAVGIVTTAKIPDATPAAVIAHFPSRDQEEGIAREMILEQPTTVVIGAGHPFGHRGRLMTDRDPAECDYSAIGGRYVFEALKKNNGFADALYAEDRADFEKIADAVPGSGRELPKRLIGLIKGIGLPPVDGFESEEGRRIFDEIYVGGEPDAIPTLATLSRAALNTLAQNPNGFYLMVEAAAIDSANHGEGNLGMMVLHHEGFTKAIEAVCAWVEAYSSWDETLLIVTADHETGQLWGPGTYEDANGNNRYDEGEKDNGFVPIANNGPGRLPGVQHGSDYHTNALVPLWAKGAGADSIDSFIRGRDEKAGEMWRFSGDYIDNTDITPWMKKASGVGFEEKGK